MRISMTISVAVLGATVLVGATGEAVAGSKKPFSATAVQTFKDQQVQSGTIFVSGDDTRFEYVERGREMVKIILPEQKIMRILFPQDKLYREIQAPADAPTQVSGDSSPCPQIDGLTCKKIADAKFGAFDVEQWQQHHTPTNTSSMLWWEPQRNMIVRQEFPDGRIMQLTMSGNVDFEGRQVERWDMSLADPNGKVTTAYQLVDTDIGIIVKEENPAMGLSRELRGLKVSASAAGWFDVPAGYQRIEAPKTPTK